MESLHIIKQLCRNSLPQLTSQKEKREKKRWQELSREIVLCEYHPRAIDPQNKNTSSRQ